jgi:hypothetical protein
MTERSEPIAPQDSFPDCGQLHPVGTRPQLWLENVAISLSPALGPFRQPQKKKKPEARQRLTSTRRIEKNPFKSKATLALRLEQQGGEFASAVSKTGTNAPGLSNNRKFTAFRFAVLRRPQPLRSRSHETFCQPNSQSPPAGHGSVESRQRPDRLRPSVPALSRPSFKQRDSAHAGNSVSQHRKLTSEAIRESP